MLTYGPEAHYQYFSFIAVLPWFETFEDKDNVGKAIANPAQVLLCF